MSHQLETIIGYKFKHPELLETALTHTSYANETRPPVKHNERLEFLGDSVLQIVSADYLFHAYADRPEGDLTRIRSSLVSEGALFQFAQEINLGDYLRLGRGEEHCGGRTRPSVVSDAFEALIAALYLDGGMEAAKQHAQELAELHTLEEFEAQCEAYTVYNDDESYWQTASVLRRESCWTAISYLRDWLSGERAYGDTTVAEASNGYYVAFFREESDNDYPTVNLKYFTVSGADANDDIRDYLDAFSKSDGSAQSFFELSDNIRDKDYNRSDNRKISSITYDNATILTVPEDVLDWAFDKARTKGDVTTIHGEDCWYVLYFDGFGETASRMIADKQLRTERYKEWTAEVQSNISYAEGRYFSKTASR